MFKIFRLFASVLLLSVFIAPVLAKLSGAGEITGTVYESWTQDGRVIFRMNIQNQKTDLGPALDTPNIFVYAGDDRAQITDGDVLNLRYDSDDADGIIVTNLSFIENRKGSVGQSKTLSAVITLSGLITGVILIVGGILYQKRRQRI